MQTLYATCWSVTTNCVKSILRDMTVTVRHVTVGVLSGVTLTLQMITTVSHEMMAVLHMIVVFLHGLNYGLLFVVSMAVVVKVLTRQTVIELSRSALMNVVLLGTFRHNDGGRVYVTVCHARSSLRNILAASKLWRDCSFVYNGDLIHCVVTAADTSTSWVSLWTLVSL